MSKEGRAHLDRSVDLRDCRSAESSGDDIGDLCGRDELGLEIEQGDESNIGFSFDTGRHGSLQLGDSGADLGGRPEVDFEVELQSVGQLRVGRSGRARVADELSAEVSELNSEEGEKTYASFDEAGAGLTRERGGKGERGDAAEESKSRGAHGERYERSVGDEV